MLKQFSKINKRIILSGVIGNFLENFDVMICAFLSQTIALTFFPSNSANNNIINTFLIFLISYLARPLGSLVLGLYSDQVGRKKTIILSVLMVGFGTAVIGIIPSYAVIGVSSTILFSLFRILQNFSVGGEYISSISYLVESAKNGQKGFFGCWVSVGFNSGTLLASFLSFVFIYGIDNNILPFWSWRIIFVISLLGTFIGFWIRRALPESLEFILENSETKIHKKRDIFFSSLKLIRNYPVRSLAIIVITWLGVGETAALFVYSPIHMTMINHLSQYQALGINTLSLMFLIPLIPIFGLLSDYLSKLKLLIMSTCSFLMLSLTYFNLLSSGTFLEILLIKLLFCIPSACYYAIAPVFITENFPIRLRCTSLALIYQTTLSIAAGVTPLVLLYIVSHFKDTPYFPAYYLILLCIFGLWGLFYLASNKHIPTDINQKLIPNELF